MSTPSNDDLHIPAAGRHDVEQVFNLTDLFCAEHLDAEYGELVRKLVAKLARKRPSPLARGDLRSWAAAPIYTVGSAVPPPGPRAASPSIVTSATHRSTGSGTPLQVEMLDEVTHAAWRDAAEPKKLASKWPPRRRIRAE